jgi:hypothetical protein
MMRIDFTLPSNEGAIPTINQFPSKMKKSEAQHASPSQIGQLLARRGGRSDSHIPFFSVPMFIPFFFSFK